MLVNNTIAVIEDSPSIREMVEYYLSSVGYKVAAFESGEEFFAAMPEMSPMLLILDLMLPGMDGFEILKKLRGNAKYAQLPVIMLTAKTTEIDRVKGLEAGADDYIVKPFGVLELVARIKTVLRRAGVGQEPDQLSYRDIVLNLPAREATRGGERLDLTFKEYELLKYLIRNKGLVMDREELLRNIWGYDYTGETRTVDVHIKTLRQKLTDDSENPRYIKTVRGVGYKMEA